MALPRLTPDQTVIKCRHCGSTSVRPSHKSSGQGLRVTYRCQDCKRHFRVGDARTDGKILVAGIAAFSLLTIGLIVALFMGDTEEVTYAPRIDTSDTVTVGKIQKEAARGNHQAEYDMGWVHWQRDEHLQALPWIKAAADHGHAEAEYLLGMAYLNGRGTVQNYRSAFEQMTKAAHHGHLEAQYQLGIFHRDGLGTPPSKESAYLWLNIAAARGHGDALQLRDRLAANMPRNEIERAQEASARTIAELANAAMGKP